MDKIVNIWIDALDFHHKGGWKEDTQFTHLTGSGYLIAADEPGVPVADASATVKISHKDTYRIWVRDRNWLRPHNPGTFTLLVNGKENGVILGQQPSDAWIWEIAGDFDLDGDTELTVRDLTGYFGRFSSILITNDFDYVPAREIDRMHTERARIKGLPTGTSYGGDYDVIVAGGGPGGMPAAVACARLGIKTLLIHNRPILGGNGSSEVGITFDGAEVAHPRAREGGIAEEIRRLRDRETKTYGEWTHAMEKIVADERNLTIIYNSHVTGVEMENESTIKAVTTLDILNLTKSRYTGKIFIDCTGDAWIGYHAGAKYRFGREAAYQHNEDMAPDIADTQTMSGCIRGGIEPFIYKSDEESEFHAPAWVPKLPETDEEFGRVIQVPRMYWWLEAPNTYDDMYDGEQTRDALFLVILGYFDHIKNHWSGKDTLKKTKFRIASIFDGRRESRRLIGDYILTQDDCIEGRRFDDAISYSGWALDIHHPEGIYSGKKGPLYCAKGVALPSIPYRCIYSKNIDNLFFAGRNVSVTHIALGTVRVQNTIATLGQAAGTAAAMCIKLNETPRGIYQRHIKDLQQLLIKNDQYIPGFKNEDPNDPCLTASVTASSVSTSEVYNPKHGSNGPIVPLDEPRIAVAGFNPNRGDINQIYLKLHSTNIEDKNITVYVRPVGDLDTHAGMDTEPYTAVGTVPPGESWVHFPVQIKINPADFRDGGYLMVWVDACDGVSWFSLDNLSTYRRIGVRDDRGDWYFTGGKCYQFSIKKPDEIIADCSPENVINGHSRILSATEYEWVSNPNETLPQWLEVKFKEKTRINYISLVFDTDMTNPGTCFGFKFKGVPVCVKKYNVEVFDGDKWTQVADVEENFMRKCNHSFNAIDTEKIRINVYSTWGDRSARITEVRAALDM